MTSVLEVACRDLLMLGESGRKIGAKGEKRFGTTGGRQR